MTYRAIIRNIDGEGQNFFYPLPFPTAEDAMERAVADWYRAQATDLKLLEFSEQEADSWWVAEDEDGISSVIVFLEGSL